MRSKRSSCNLNIILSITSEEEPTYSIARRTFGITREFKLIINQRGFQG